MLIRFYCEHILIGYYGMIQEPQYDKILCRRPSALTIYCPT